MPLILGLDPGLRFTGWGLIAADRTHLRHLANGVIPTDSATPVPTRLKTLHPALADLIAAHHPDEAAALLKQPGISTAFWYYPSEPAQWHTMR